MSEAYAITVDTTGGPEVLKKTSLTPRAPGAGEALIRQTAIGLNFIDTYMRSGLYPARLPLTLGLEGTGEVEAVGEGVTHIKPGDRVGYSGVSGTYATHVTGPASQMVRLPDTIDDETAAAAMLKGLTAWMLLFEIRPVRAGDTLLVWAAAGGVGSFLVPWARTLGARVIGIVSTEEKAALAQSYGCDETLLSSDDIPARVRELTNGKGADISLDSVGKDSAMASLKSLAPRGLWITYGNASGPVDPLPPALLAQNGSLLMTRPTLFHFTSTRDDLERGARALFGALSTGALKADIRQRFSLSDAADAHRALEARQTTGATVLIPD